MACIPSGYRYWNKPAGHPAPRVHGGKGGQTKEQKDSIKEYVDWLRLAVERGDSDVVYKGKILKRFI